MPKNTTGEILLSIELETASAEFGAGMFGALLAFPLDRSSTVLYFNS
jgi:hypothetical protein